MKIVLHVFIFLILPWTSYSQNGRMARDLFLLINEARTNPKGFLQKHGAAIQKANPSYHSFLSQTATPQRAISWDAALELMAKSVVVNGTLNPVYSGQNDYCGFSWGRSAGNLNTDPLLYLIDFYTNAHSSNYAAIGLYFNPTITSYCYQWARSCDVVKMQFPKPDPVDTSMVNFDKLNTARAMEYMSPAERKMLSELNFVRTYPSVYAGIIKDYLHRKSESHVGLDEADYLAGIELVEELGRLTPLQLLLPSSCVYDAAKLHGMDSKKRGFFSHTGSDGSDPWDRILRKCTQYRSGNENGVGGASDDPRVHVINLLLDSGVPSRGHRRNILDANWKYGACFRYDDATYKNFWIQNFAY
jgi:uncharacterized protein YkwD